MIFVQILNEMKYEYKYKMSQTLLGIECTYSFVCLTIHSALTLILNDYEYYGRHVS